MGGGGGGILFCPLNFVFLPGVFSFFFLSSHVASFRYFGFLLGVFFRNFGFSRGIFSLFRLFHGVFFFLSFRHFTWCHGGRKDEITPREKSK